MPGTLPLVGAVRASDDCSWTHRGPRHRCVPGASTNQSVGVCRARRAVAARRTIAAVVALTGLPAKATRTVAVAWRAIAEAALTVRTAGETAVGGAVGVPALVAAG